MKISNYLEAIKDIPSATKIKHSLNMAGGSSSFSSSEIFLYDSAVSMQTESFHHFLIATGPVYKLDWPTENRLAAFFLPDGVPMKEFLQVSGGSERFPMPILSRNALSKLAKAGVSSEEVSDAITMLTFAGKALIPVKPPHGEIQGTLFAFTMQGPPDNVLLFSTMPHNYIPQRNWF